MGVITETNAGALTADNGDSTVIVLALTIVIRLRSRSVGPNRTAVASENPNPLIVTGIPPAMFPESGDIDVISGNVSGSTVTIVVSVFSSPLVSVTVRVIICSPTGSVNDVTSPLASTVVPLLQTKATSVSSGPCVCDSLPSTGTLAKPLPSVSTAV